MKFFKKILITFLAKLDIFGIYCNRAFYLAVSLVILSTEIWFKLLFLAIGRT